MPQAEKVKKVDEISENLTSAKSIFMADFTGLSVAEMTELRREFRKAEVNFVVVKNTLARLSAEKTGMEQMLPYLNGPTGLALAYGDPIAPARVISDFQKQNDKPRIKAAILEGELLDEESAVKMKDIPPREVLLAQIVGGISSPISGLVGGLKAILNQFVYTLDAIKEKKES
jgi:large subunit ribosomal protein L10